MRFASLEEMRQHYTTDYHVANVRSRVEGQAKVTQAEFKRRNVTEVDETKPIYNCKLCSKQFHSVQTLQSHIKSTEHLMRKEQRIIERDSNAGSALSSTSLGSAALGLHRRYRAHMRARLKQKEAAASGANLNDFEPAADGEPVKPKVTAVDREADVTETRCLFCGHPAKTMRANLKHMLDVHEFTVPLADRVIDMRDLLQYLGRKLNGLMCLVCGDKTKKYESLEALRAHMAAANHERLTLSSEYAAFYTGAIDDGDAVVVPTIDDGSAALVVRGDTTRRITKKDPATIGMVRHSNENPQQTEQRRALAIAGSAESQLILKERRQETQKERTKHFKEINHFYRRQKYFLLKTGIKKLWMKGFDGEGEMA